MRRLWTFALGVVVGGLLLWGALQYHVLNTKQGLKFIPKVNAGLAMTYVDIRQFTVADWLKKPTLARALANANQSGLFENATDGALQNSLDHLLDRVEEQR